MDREATPGLSLNSRLCVHCYVMCSGGHSQHGQGYFLHCVKNVTLISHLLIMFLSVSSVAPRRLHLAWSGGLHQSSPTGFISLGRWHQSDQPHRPQSAWTGGINQISPTGLSQPRQEASIRAAPQASVILDRRHLSYQPHRPQSAWTGGINQISPTGLSQPGQEASIY